MAGSDMRILETTDATADINGIAKNTLKNLPIVTGVALIMSKTTPVIGIFLQYAAYGEGCSIHSALQLRAFGADVNDISSRLPGGSKCILTPDGYNIPTFLWNGLPYIDMRPPTDKELVDLPHVLFTSDIDWDPSNFDIPDHHEIEGHDDNPTQSLDLDDCVTPTRDIVNRIDEVDLCARKICTQQVHRRLPDLEKLRPCFGWAPTDRIRHTLEHTTQYARATPTFPFRRHFKSRFPGANVPRLNEVVATDTYFADTPAHDDGISGHGGATTAQVFCG